MFFCEEGGFRGETPTIAAEFSGGADDAVARDGEGHRVSAAGVGDGARGGRLADGGGDFGVAARFAGGDGAEVGPDEGFKGRGADVEGKIGHVGAGVYCGEDGLVPVAEGGGVGVGFGAGGVGELGFEALFEGVLGRAEFEEAEAVVGGGEGDGAKGCFERHPGDFEAFAAGAVLGGRHAEIGGGLFVETGGGRVAGVVHGCGDGVGLAELGL